MPSPSILLPLESKEKTKYSLFIVSISSLISQPTGSKRRSWYLAMAERQKLSYLLDWVASTKLVLTDGNLNLDPKIYLFESELGVLKPHWLCFCWIQLDIRAGV
ncbi:hypothetical protein TNIN_354281 [Trichonephila inaurata madagascariensis]|uniref:Uncharacterized protein n=1 Tax=Trichonephila inaurata madagascariensis TaxID=2747483 RepID=A0A8X6JCL7_9ARAC|nr:hypothetical protein TNIN_354281 [Trichonephila inaurata madagascariensis]